jgi:hypothetical protein
MGVLKEEISRFNDFIAYLTYVHGYMDKQIAESINKSPSVLSDAKRGKLTQATIHAVQVKYADDYSLYMARGASDIVKSADPQGDRELYIHYKAKYELVIDQYASLLKTMSQSLSSIETMVKNISQVQGETGGRIKTQIRAADRVHR